MMGKAVMFIIINIISILLYIGEHCALPEHKWTQTACIEIRRHDATRKYETPTRLDRIHNKLNSKYSCIKYKYCARVLTEG